MTEEGKIPVSIHQVDSVDYGDAPADDIINDIVVQINKKNSEQPWQPESTTIAKDGLL